jgi:predicted O-methyltransferase YrrM
MPPDSIPPSFDPGDATRYIAGLMPDELTLALTAETLVGVQTQPTIGRLAASLVDLLVRSRHPNRILEIGTSYGYSTCVLGRAASSYGGKVMTIERNPRLAQAARENLAGQGLDAVVEVIVGDAMELVGAIGGQFGLILQDGGKEDYSIMLERLFTLLEPGGLLVSDDILFPVMNLPESVAHWKAAMHEYNRNLKSRKDLKTVWLPIGDGIAISVKTR